MPNITRPLAFADGFIQAQLVEDAQDFPVTDAVVVILDEPDVPVPSEARRVVSQPPAYPNIGHLVQ